MENGTSTSKQIKDSFPPNKRDSIASVIADCKRMDCIIETAPKTFKANPDYVWDDVGVVKYPSLADLKKMAVNDEPVVKDGEIDWDALAKKAESGEDIDDISIDELADQIDELFSDSSAGSLASLVLDRKTRNKLYYTIEFDDHDCVMHMTAKVSAGALHLIMPCVAVDDNDDEVAEFEWKGKDTVDIACSKLRTLKMSVGLLSAALVKISDEELADL